MAGLILLLFGLAKMGAVIKFIPAPVIVGFTAGIGVIIWVGQWKIFLVYRKSRATISIENSGIPYKYYHNCILQQQAWRYSV